MEMSPQEQNYYMQQQQHHQQQQQLQQQQHAPPQAFTRSPQTQQQSYPHMNQMQHSQYQYQQMRMLGMGYPRQSHNMSSNRNIPMSPSAPDQNAPMNNNMYSMNSSLRRANSQSQTYPANSMSHSGQINGMGPWEQALNEPYSPYNQYPASPSPQHMSVPRNQNMTLSHNQNMQSPRNQNTQLPRANSQVTHNASATITHNPTPPMAHSQNSSIPLQSQYNGIQNPIVSNYQPTPSQSTMGPPAVTANSTFGNPVKMQNMARQQNMQGTNGGGGTGIRHLPQLPGSIMTQLTEPLSDDDNQGILNQNNCMPDLNCSQGNKMARCNPENTRNSNNYNTLSELDQVKKEHNQNELVKEVKPIVKSPIRNMASIKSEDHDNNAKWNDGFSDIIPPGMLPESEEDFELITKSLMEKPFDAFRELNSESPSAEDMIPSICKSPVAQNTESKGTVCGTESGRELQKLDPMSLTVLSKKCPSENNVKSKSSTIPQSSNGCRYSIPMVMQNFYNELVSENKKSFPPFVKQNECAAVASGATKNNTANNGESLQLPNCSNQQPSCDKVSNFPSCATEIPSNIPTFNFEFDDELDAFLPNFGNKLVLDRNMNYLESLPVNSDEKGNNNQNVMQRTVSTPDVQSKGKGGIRKSRNKSDSDPCKPANKRNKGTAKKTSRKSPYDCGNKNTKKVVNISDNKNDDKVATATSSTATTTTVVNSSTVAAVPEKLAAIKKLYYENKLNYKFHHYLRQLISDSGQDGDDNYPHKKKLQNCEKIFLKQLSNTNLNMDSWIKDSLIPGVEKEKDIDLINMTKRKITIYEDIPSDSIYEFLDKSRTEPFHYLCPNNDLTQEPSKKLVDILLQKK